MNPVLAKYLVSFNLPAFLQDLTSLVIVLINREGDVLTANRGFLRIAHTGPQALASDKPWNVRHLFVNPRFKDLVLYLSHADEKPLFQGILNIGTVDKTYYSLQGWIYDWNGSLLVVAEHDVVGLEKLSATVLKLNEELASTQREVVRTNRALQRSEATIRKLLNTDTLTGVANRRRLQEYLDIEFQRSRRYGKPLCLIMADIDYFKKVNDRYGHPAGDEVLKSVASALQQQVRGCDLVARYGGEEFVVVLPETSLDSAGHTAERLHHAIGALRIPPLENPVTASFGVALLAPDENIEGWLKRADNALYSAKNAGRNRVVLSS